jgi:hypothetical protein
MWTALPLARRLALASLAKAPPHRLASRTHATLGGTAGFPVSSSAGVSLHPRTRIESASTTAGSARRLFGRSSAARAASSLPSSSSAAAAVPVDSSIVSAPRGPERIPLDLKGMASVHNSVAAQRGFRVDTYVLAYVCVLGLILCVEQWAT